jgi:hypothetical protein
MNFVNHPRKRKAEKPREPSPCSRCGKKFVNLETRYVFADGKVLCEKCYEGSQASHGFCPVCGSTDVLTGSINESLPVPFGPAATFTTTQYTCNTCGESGDFAGENNSTINEALKKSTALSVSEMFEYLSKEGITAAYLERALRLPPRTTARWKGGNLSAAALALLRFVRTYPWLLAVADANFESSAAKQKLFEVVFEDIKSRRKILGRITHNEIEWLIDALDRLQWHKNCAETPVLKDHKVLTSGRSGSVSVEQVEKIVAMVLRVAFDPPDTINYPFWKDTLIEICGFASDEKPPEMKVWTLGEKGIYGQGSGVSVQIGKAEFQLLIKKTW